MNLFKKNRHIWIIIIYGILYMIAFVCLEKSNKEPNIIHFAADDYIPFCEYFIIPYVMWYGFVAVTLWYFAFRCKKKEEYYQLIGTLIAGNTVFLVTSFVYPNGQDLRPALTGDSLFIQAVKILYWIDTPTNILPSMHVFNAITCCTALFKNSKCQKHKRFLTGTGLLTILIILSTMFLKQHTVIDGILAAILYIFCYLVFYKFIPLHKEQISSLMTKKEILTIPNLLSIFRLALAILFLGIVQRGGMEENKTILIIILVISAISDFLDGKIARKFHMVSEVGKLIDPIADKVTQGVLLLCLFSEYDLTKWIFVLFLVKESYMAVIGTKTVMKIYKNEGAQWYGKVSTTVFYVVMIVLILFRDISKPFANVLIGCCGGCMLLAFVMYVRRYHVFRRERNNRKSLKNLWKK